MPGVRLPPRIHPPTPLLHPLPCQWKTGTAPPGAPEARVGCCHYDEQVCDGEMEEEKGNGLCAGERSGTEDVAGEEEQVHLGDYAAIWSRVMPRSVLPPRVMSGSVALQQLGSGLKSVAHVTTKGHMDARGLGPYLRPH